MDKFYFHRQVQKLKEEIADKLIDHSLIGQVKKGVYIKGAYVAYDEQVQHRGMGRAGLIPYPSRVCYYGTATTKAGKPRKDGREDWFSVEIDWSKQ